MAYSEELEQMIDSLSGDWPDMEKKKMFGGVGYLLKGNMCFGIHKDYLIVRMDREQGDRVLEEDGNAQPFDITGKPMSGWVMVAEPGWFKEEQLQDWLAIGRDFALTLPAK